MSNMKDVRLLGLEDKNEFLDFFNWKIFER